MQSHSGSQANQAVFLSCLSPGDTILGMSLNAGGHLTHGSPVNLSGKYFNVVAYGLNDDEEIDYDELECLALMHTPKLIIAGASSYALQIDFARFRDISNKVNALFLADISHYSGLIAAKLYDSPVAYADFIVSTTHKTLRGPRGGFILAKEEYAKSINSAVFPGIQGGPLEHIIAAKAQAFWEAQQPEFIEYQKQVISNAQLLVKLLAHNNVKVVGKRTDCHLILLSLLETDMNGLELSTLLEQAGIIVNKNMVPQDTRSPKLTSGIRLGTSAITTRGFKEKECEALADIINKLVQYKEKYLLQAKQEVLSLCQAFPISV